MMFWHTNAILWLKITTFCHKNKIVGHESFPRRNASYFHASGTSWRRWIKSSWAPKVWWRAAASSTRFVTLTSAPFPSFFVGPSHLWCASSPQIGTYQMAACAKAHNKAFYVVAESFKFVRLYPLNQQDVPDRFKVG